MSFGETTPTSQTSEKKKTTFGSQFRTLYEKLLGKRDVDDLEAIAGRATSMIKHSLEVIGEKAENSTEKISQANLLFGLNQSVRASEEQLQDGADILFDQYCGDWKKKLLDTRYETDAQIKGAFTSEFIRAYTSLVEKN